LEELLSQEKKIKQSLEADRQTLRREIEQGKITLKKARKASGEGFLGSLKKRWPWK